MTQARGGRPQKYCSSVSMPLPASKQSTEQNIRQNYKATDYYCKLIAVYATIPTAEGVCLYFLGGNCKKGEKCPQVHVSEGELDEYLEECRKKEKARSEEDAAKSQEEADEDDYDDEPQKMERICGFHLRGTCTFGDKCKFKHIDEGILQRLKAVDQPNKSEYEEKHKQKLTWPSPTSSQKEKWKPRNAKEDEDDYDAYEAKEYSEGWQEGYEDEEWCKDDPWYAVEEDETNNSWWSNGGNKKWNEDKGEGRHASAQWPTEWKNNEKDWRGREETWPTGSWTEEATRYKGAQKVKGKGKAGKGKGKSSKHKSQEGWSSSPFNTFQGRSSRMNW